MKKTLLTLAFAAIATIAAAAPADRARVDFYNTGGPESKVLPADLGGLAFETPKWMVRPAGAGMLVQAKATADWQEKTFKIKVVGDGKIQIRLLGPDVRDKEGKKQPYNVDYSLLEVNGKALLDSKDGAPLTVWHDKAKQFEVAAKDGEELTVKIKYRSSAQ
ncbi:MAG: hypothetical protein AB7F32_02800 [Victivallaceae bacterium]